MKIKLKEHITLLIKADECEKSSKKINTKSPHKHITLIIFI